eukprot:1222118-Pleurochrysis_carterae.AAC.1
MHVDSGRAHGLIDRQLGYQLDTNVRGDRLRPDAHCSFTVIARESQGSTTASTLLLCTRSAALQMMQNRASDLAYKICTIFLRNFDFVRRTRRCLTSTRSRCKSSRRASASPPRRG